jgi:hypothetical protein
MSGELSGYKWSAIKRCCRTNGGGRRVTTVACSAASSGFFAQVLHDVTCPRSIVPALVTIAPFGGGGLASGPDHERTGRWL